LIAATRARSGSSAMAWLTSRPIRPAAPSTPTRITAFRQRARRYPWKRRRAR
jgi:hypothetical protein